MSSLPSWTEAEADLARRALDAYESASLAIALEAVSGAGKPLQKLLVVDEAQGVMFPIPLSIRDRDREARFRAGELGPSFGRETILDVVDGHVMRDSVLVVVGR